MLAKIIDIFALATGIVTALSAIAFAVFTKINNEMAITVCGMSLLLVGGMYIATAILTIIGKFVTKN